MINKMYIKIENNVIEPCLKTPYIKLLLDLTDGICILPSNNLKNIKTIIDEILFDLTPREEKIIRLYYDLDAENHLDFIEIGKIFNLSEATVKKIYSKALRKLKHPNRINQILKISHYEIKNISNNDTIYQSYEKYLNEILLNDIKSYNEFNCNNLFILDKILQNRLNYFTENMANIEIDDLDFSTRVFSALHKQGIVYLKELLTLADEDYNAFHIPGNRIKKELSEIINYFTPPASSEYNLNIEHFKVNTLFYLKLSLPLIRELIYMGYININDVMRNFNIILLKLKDKQNLYDELVALKLKIIDGTIIFNTTLDLFSFISKYKIETYEDLIDNMSKATKKSLHENILTIQRIKEKNNYNNFRITFEYNDISLDKSKNEEQEIITNELDDDLLDLDISLDFDL